LGAPWKKEVSYPSEFKTETTDSISLLAYGEDVKASLKEGMPAKIDYIPWMDFLPFAKALSKTRLLVAKESRKGV